MEVADAEYRDILTQTWPGHRIATLSAIDKVVDAIVINGTNDNMNETVLSKLYSDFDYNVSVYHIKLKT